MLARLYRVMVRIRAAEEAIARLYPEQEMRCPTHLSIGQEAVAAGVCAVLEPCDVVLASHRCHAAYLAKGGSMRTMFAELYGRATGCTGGWGGSMHLAAPDTGMLGASAILAGSVPIAVGCALAAKLRGERTIAVAFFGDAAVEEGTWHESMNCAALWQLPVVFVCENNLYATSTPIAQRQVRAIHARAQGYGVVGYAVDGNDAKSVLTAAKAARGYALGGTPVFIEARTYRWLGHVGVSDDSVHGYRAREEVEAWKGRDPVAALARELRLTAEEQSAVRAEADVEVEDAVAFAKSSSWPEVALAYA